MKKFFNLFLSLPLIGLSSIYFYVLISMVSIGSTEFYKLDPKDTPAGFVYNFLITLPLVGYFSILIGAFILLIDFVEYKGNITSNYFKWLYFIGVALTIFLYYVDLGYCQIWFFD